MNFNFELILFYATLVCGLYALLDILFLAPRRKRANKEKMPLLSDYARSFFPVLLIVFLLRSFVYEPFRIPSGSLEPSLLVGEFILVNKFDYGIRLPVAHTILYQKEGSIHRGDIFVFRYPPDPSIYYIKRVIGLPGDHISYINKELYVNGQKAPQQFEKNAVDFDDEGNTWNVVQKQEDFLGVKHPIYQNPDRPAEDFQDLVVPKDMYFAMGDNRDDSADSRYWGFVPNKNIVGKASLIWMSWDSRADWLHKIRWDRIGKVVH